VSLDSSIEFDEHRRWTFKKQFHMSAQMVSYIMQKTTWVKFLNSYRYCDSFTKWKVRYIQCNLWSKTTLSSKHKFQDGCKNQIY
jgi:hypothetical protein